MVGHALGKVTNEQYKSAGYFGSAYLYYEAPGCFYDYSYLGAYVYGSKSKFKTTGQTGYLTMGGDSFEGLSLYFRFANCPDRDTVNYLYASVYEYFYTSNNQNLFTIESKKLAEASLNIKVPVYSGSCTLYCYDVCYADIFGYGSCPPEEPVEECYYSSCVEEVFEGVADFTIKWNSNALTPPATQTVSSYRYQSDGYWSMNRSRGQTRYDMLMSVTATIDGMNILPSSLDYLSGELGTTMDMSMYKYKSPGRK